MFNFRYRSKNAITYRQAGRQAGREAGASGLIIPI